MTIHPRGHQETRSRKDPGHLLRCDSGRYVPVHHIHNVRLTPEPLIMPMPPELQRYHAHSSELRGRASRPSRLWAREWAQPKAIAGTTSSRTASARTYPDRITVRPGSAASVRTNHLRPCRGPHYHYHDQEIGRVSGQKGDRRAITAMSARIITTAEHLKKLSRRPNAPITAPSIIYQLESPKTPSP